RDGAQQHTVEFAFDDVCVAEVVEIEADDVEDAVGNERKAVEEENFLEAPSGELRRFLKKDDDEEESENRGGKAREQADDEVAAIADANDRVLREVIVEEQRVAFDADEERIWRGRRCCHYRTRLAQRECSCFVVFFLCCVGFGMVLFCGLRPDLGIDQRFGVAHSRRWQIEKPYTTPE